VVSVLVNSLYMVFARAIGLWLESRVGSRFFYNSIVRLVFQEVGIWRCLKQCLNNRYSMW
jgi:hypothetical protein